MFSAPRSRYRLYTRPASYTAFLGDVLSGRYRQGDDVGVLENRIADLFQVRHAVATPMARVGIHLAIKALIKPGSSVIMSPYTIADVVNMVICAGGRPVFADVKRTTCNIDPNEVEKLIDQSTGAVLVTHLHGLSAETAAIKRVCDAHNVPLVEDAAQAFGARDDGRRVGTTGDAGVFSLGAYKNINCWFGGLVVTDSDELAGRVRNELRSTAYQSPRFVFRKLSFGMMTDIVTSPLLFSAATFWIFRFGALKDVEWINRFVRTELDTSRHDTVPDEYLARLSPFQARLALSQLGNIDHDTDIRIRAASAYHEMLGEAPNLVLPPLRTDRSHIYTYYPVQYENSDDLLKWLMYHKRDVGAQHLKNCADLDSFAEFRRDCPNARAVARSVVLLPTYPRYGMREVHRTAESVLAYLQTHRTGAAFESGHH